MTFAVEFTETARADLINILAFIARDSPRRATTFVEELEARIRRQLEAFPESGKMMGNHRFAIFAGYVAVYRIDSQLERVLVVVVAEGHRDWRSAFE